MSYEEYDDSWDLEDQSKKCKKAANCLLASCDCRGESEPIRDEREDMPVHLPAHMVAELGRRAGIIAAGEARHLALIPSLSSSDTGRYSNPAAGLSSAATYDSSNPITGTVSQLNRKSGRIQSSSNPRSRNRSWSVSLYHMGLMILFMFLSITVTEGVMDWSESPHQMYMPDCKLQPMMYSYTMPREDLFLFNDIKRNLTRKQGVWSRQECQPPKIGDTSPVEFCHKRARAIQEVLHHPAYVKGLKVRCVRQDQHRTRGCGGIPQCVDIPHSVERYQGEDQDETRGRSNPNREVEVQCRRYLMIS